MKTTQFANGWVDAARRSPQLGHSVLYRTATHQALGFRDSTGRWLSFDARVESEPVLAWTEQRRVRTPAA